MGYERELEWNEPPSPDERRYARWTVVRAAGAPGRVVVAAGAHRRGRSLPRAAGERAGRAGAVRRRRLVAAKRGRRGSGDYVGVDGHVQTDALRDRHRRRTAPARARTPSPPPAIALGRHPRRGHRRRVRQARRAAGAAVEGPIRVGLPGDDATRIGADRAIGARSRHGDGGRRAGGVSGRARRPVPDCRASPTPPARTWRRPISRRRSRPRSVPGTPTSSSSR